MGNASVLLVDCGEHSMDLLAARIGRLGHAVVRVKTAADAFLALHNPAVAALVLPPDAPLADPRRAIEQFREGASGRALSILVAGPRPPHSIRVNLHSAGVDYSLLEPIDAHALRFQLNQALAWRHSPKSRRAERGPVTWNVRMKAGRRVKEGRLYTVSPCGVFVAHEAPWLRGTELKLDVELPSGDRLKLKGRVALTNVKGNLRKAALPLGMGVKLLKPSERAQAQLVLTVEQRLRRLQLTR